MTYEKHFLDVIGDGYQAMKEASPGEAGVGAPPAVPPEPEGDKQSEGGIDIEALDPQTQAEVDEALTPPESPADYDLGQVRSFEDDPDLEGDTPEETAQGMEVARQLAHQAGLTQGDLNAILPRYNELMGEGESRHDLATIETRQTECRAVLQKLWGDDYEANFVAAQKEADNLGPGFVNFLEATRLGDDPVMFRSLADAVNQREARQGRHSARAARQAQSTSMTAEAAKAELAKIRTAAMADPKHPYINSLHPEQKAVTARMMELYSSAYPGDVAAT